MKFLRAVEGWKESSGLAIGARKSALIVLGDAAASEPLSTIGSLSLSNGDSIPLCDTITYLGTTFRQVGDIPADAVLLHPSGRPATLSLRLYCRTLHPSCTNLWGAQLFGVVACDTW